MVKLHSVLTVTPSPSKLKSVKKMYIAVPGGQMISPALKL